MNYDERSDEYEAHPVAGTVKNFLIAAALQQSELVRYFIEIEGLHPDAKWDGKPTAICYAVLKKNPPLLMYLLEKGANVNHVDVLGMTPLHYAGRPDFTNRTGIALRSSIKV